MTHRAYFTTVLLLICIGLFLNPVEAVQAGRDLRTDDTPERVWSTGAALDQGFGPRCVGYTYETWERAGPGPIAHPLPAASIYFGAQHYDKWPGEGYEGTDLEGGVAVLTRAGVVSSARFTRDWRALADFIECCGPVVVAVNWYWGMMIPERDGYVVPGGVRGVAESHAFMCEGFQEAHGAHGLTFTCLNSWGVGWGERGGHFYVHARDMARLLGEGSGEGVMAVKKR